MNKPDAQVSIIIPTHNRAEMLRQNLLALAKQRPLDGKMQVIIGADGCHDSTMGMLREMRERDDLPFHLEWFENAHKGPAATRNQAARMSSGEYLIFLDDDIEPSPGLVQAHLNALRSHNRRVSIGYLPVQPSVPDGYFSTELRGWWESMFEAMRDPSHRFGYTDLLSGNFAMHRALFEQAGGFAEDMHCHEDFQLGYALLQLGAELTFTEAAWGIHHEKTTLQRSLERKIAEGIADCQVGERHPELKGTLLMERLLRGPFLLRLLMRLAINWPALGDRLARVLQAGLPIVERLNRYAIWRKILMALLGYWYWRGVRRRLSSLKQIQDFLADRGEASSLPDYFLDLQHGMVEARARLDKDRPDAAQVFYGRRWVGVLPALAGCEPLSGRQLDALILTRLRSSLLTELTKAGKPGSEPLKKWLIGK